MTARLEDLKPDGLVQGLVGREAVRIVSAEMLGDMACKVVYRDQDGAWANSRCSAPTKRSWSWRAGAASGALLAMKTAATKN
jgi:hypothetical protein